MTGYPRPESGDVEEIPEWGDPYQYPAGYDGFVSFHPPGAEGWPHAHYAYLRPWPPPGATSSSGAYSASAWPLCNGYYGDDMSRQRSTAYPLSNQPVYHIDGHSRPGPMKRVRGGVHVPKRLIEPSMSDEQGYGFVDLDPKLHYDNAAPEPLIEVTSSGIRYLSDFTPKSLSSLTTVPPCKWMDLEHPRYPWKIHVTAQVPAQGCLAGVTIEDVLTTVFENLRKDVTSVEAYTVLGTADALERHRVATQDGSYRRLKRLHWLGIHSVKFLGISPDIRDPSKWHMHFSHDDLPERPLPPLPIVDDPPEYEMESLTPSFVLLDRDNIYRAIQIESYTYRPPESAAPPYTNSVRKHRSRTRVSRHHLVS